MGYYMGDYYAAGGTFNKVSQLAAKVKAAAKSPTGKKLIRVGKKVAKGKLRLVAGGHKRHHRMNALNPRALRRAIRRTHSFAKFARKVMTFQAHHKFKKGRWGGSHHRKAKV